MSSTEVPRALALGHVLLQTSNLELTESFYTGALGLTVRSRGAFRDGRPLTVTNEGLGLTTRRFPEEPALEHIAFRGFSVQRLGERAAGLGLTVVRGPERSAYGVSLYVLDPDGNQIEIFGEE